MNTLKLNANTWFTSDTHFAHTNICAGTSKWSDTSECRRFNTLDEMNKALIKMMNVAEPDDHIVHLGDWAFGAFENIELFRNNIRCKNIHLVLGNHDNNIANNENNCQSLFTSIHDIVHIKIGSTNIIGCHYPIASWINMSKGYYHLHGHVHLMPNYKVNHGKAMDVGVEGSGMKLYHITDIADILQERPIHPLVLPYDNHARRDR